jgi:hypothetical protein
LDYRKESPCRLDSPFTLSSAFVGFGARVLISVPSKLRASYRHRKSFFTQSNLFSSSSVFWEDRRTLGYPFVLCAERNRMYASDVRDRRAANHLRYLWILGCRQLLFLLSNLSVFFLIPLGLGSSYGLDLSSYCSYALACHACHASSVNRVGAHDNQHPSMPWPPTSQYHIVFLESLVQCVLGNSFSLCLLH